MSIFGAIISHHKHRHTSNSEIRSGGRLRSEQKEQGGELSVESEGRKGCQQEPIWVRNQGDKNRSESQPEMGPTVGLRGPIAGPPRTEQESEGKWQNPTAGECMSEQEKATGALGEA